MTLYFGIGAGVAAGRLLFELAGWVPCKRDDSTWTVAAALTDVLWWPLVLLVFVLHRVSAQASS